MCGYPPGPFRLQFYCHGHNWLARQLDRQKLHKITRPVQEDARSYRGFNFFDQDDEAHLLALARGEFTISGVQNKALRIRFPQYNSGQMSRILRRLRTHGLIKKARHCYKYYLTVLGKNLTT